MGNSYSISIAEEIVKNDDFYFVVNTTDDLTTATSGKSERLSIYEINEDDKKTASNCCTCGLGTKFYETSEAVWNFNWIYSKKDADKNIWTAACGGHEPTMEIIHGDVLDSGAQYKFSGEKVLQVGKTYIVEIAVHPLGAPRTRMSQSEPFKVVSKPTFLDLFDQSSPNSGVTKRKKNRSKTPLR